MSTEPNEAEATYTVTPAQLRELLNGQYRLGYTAGYAIGRADEMTGKAWQPKLDG